MYVSILIHVRIVTFVEKCFFSKKLSIRENSRTIEGGLNYWKERSFLMICITRTLVDDHKNNCLFQSLITKCVQACR